jgi:hypothetical protein
MKKKVLKTDGTSEIQEVGNGFMTWNKAIDARTGTIVPTRDGRELWADDEALLVESPQLNSNATILAGFPVFGDVIVFEPGDIE